jgi:hypothetical protein
MEQIPKCTIAGQGYMLFFAKCPRNTATCPLLNAESPCAINKKKKSAQMWSNHLHPFCALPIYGLFFFFWQSGEGYWDLNSEPHAYQVGARPLQPHHQPFSVLFFR